MGPDLLVLESELGPPSPAQRLLSSFILPLLCLAKYFKPPSLPAVTSCHTFILTNLQRQAT